MHSSIVEQLNTYIRSRQSQFTELLRQIITIPSPTGQEGKKAAWVLKYLHNLGQGQAYIDEAGNVLCPCQIVGQTAFPLYSAHMDTVFKGPTNLTPRIDGNILAAPSCGDNSAGVAGLLFLIAMIRDLDLSLPQGALFAFNIGEEGMGNLKGMRRIMADWKGRITEVVAVDCTFDDVVAIPVGSRRYRVSIEAQGGHSWMHFGHTSAIAAAASIISKLYALPVPTAPKTTYNVGTICGGTTINSIAASAEFTVDLRSESHDELERLDKAFLRLVADARTRRPDPYDDPPRRTALQQRRRYLSPMPAHRRHPQTVRPRHALYFRQYRRQHPPQPGHPGPVLRRLPQPRRTHDPRMAGTRYDRNGAANLGRIYVDGFNCIHIKYSFNELGGTHICLLYYKEIK